MACGLPVRNLTTGNPIPLAARPPSFPRSPYAYHKGNLSRRVPAGHPVDGRRLPAGKGNRAAAFAGEYWKGASLFREAPLLVVGMAGFEPATS